LNTLPHKMASSSGPRRAVADWPLIMTWLRSYEMPTAKSTLRDFRAAAWAVVSRVSQNNDFAALNLLADRGIMTPKMYAIVLNNILRQGRCVEMTMDWFDARIPMVDVVPHINRHSTWLILYHPEFRKFYARYASPELDSCLLLVTLSQQRTRNPEGLKRDCKCNIVTRTACLARNGIVLHKASRWRGARRHVFRELIQCCGLSSADLASVGLKWPKT
jgi:hypothetical protein